MVKAILIYGSTTGNTEALSEHVAAGLKQGGADVTVKDVSNTGIEELASYDAIVFGCSTCAASSIAKLAVDADAAGCGSCNTHPGIVQMMEDGRTCFNYLK